MHNTFHIVEPSVEFTLDNRLEVHLHLLAGNLHKSGQCQVFFSIQVRSDNGDLMVLDLIHFTHHYQLGSRVLGGPHFVVHIRLTDDLALKSSGKGNGNGQFGDLDLDVPQLQRLLHGVVVVADGLQRAGHLIFCQVDVHDDGEAQCDRACAGGNHHSINSTEGVYKGGHSVLGVIQQACQITGLHVTENQRRADGNGNHVDHGSHVVTQRNHTELKTHFHAAFGYLLDDIANHKGHNALGLVVLDHFNHIFGIISLAQHNGNTGNIAGNQRHTQGADDGVGHKADAGIVFIGIAALGILEAFDNFSANSGGKTGIERLSQVFLVGDQALQHTYAGRQIAQGLYLHTGSGINGGEIISGIGKCDGMVCAIFFDGCIDRAFS